MLKPESPEPVRGQAECIAVAMSGGVDSSVVAALLKREGYRVIGVTLQLHVSKKQSIQAACAADAVMRAGAVAEQLGIPHDVVDASAEFERIILRHVWSEYVSARTPSPCLLCNERIKFGVLMDWAGRQGALKLATGHYARIERDAAGRPALYRGANRDKDQSYFLAGLTREQLDRVLFPLGHITGKSEVRELAKSFGLSCAESPESQDACMAEPDQSFAELLRERFGGESRAGDVLDESGKLLGRHGGIHRFTIGQRRGIPIQASGRRWVKALRPHDAAVIVTGDVEHLYGDHLTADNLNWLADDWVPGRPLCCRAQVRYRHAAAPAVVTMPEPDVIDVRFEVPVRAITPGQAVVMYDQDRVLGRAWIRNTVMSGR